MLTHYKSLKNNNTNDQYIDLSKPGDDVLQKTRENTKRELEKLTGQKLKTTSVNFLFNF
jgi:hypothetical protein